MNFEEYLDDVKSQLYCNASSHYRSNYVTYGYSNSQIEENLIFFNDCFNSRLSAYKALLFFSDYLKNEDWRKEIEQKYKY
jgi:hypothetical protein